MGESQIEKAYEKHAWIFLVAAAIVILVDGLLILVAEGIVQPLIDPTYHTPRSLLGTRQIGLDWFVISVFAITLSRRNFRKGEKWSWYLLWIIPIFLVTRVLVIVSVGRYAGVGPSWPFSNVTVIGLPLSLLGLLLPYRKFFPKTPAARS